MLFDVGGEERKLVSEIVQKFILEDHHDDLRSFNFLLFLVQLLLVQGGNW